MKKLIVLAVLALFVVGAMVSAHADDIKGKMESIDVPAANVYISGVEIYARNATVVNEEDTAIDLTALEVGDYLEVEGAFAGPGKFRAGEIKKGGLGQDEIEGRVKVVNAQSNKLIIKGVTVKVSDKAELRDDDGEKITLRDINAGNSV